MSVSVTPESKWTEWTSIDTPQLSLESHSTGSDYSPSMASVRTAVRLEITKIAASAAMTPDVDEMPILPTDVYHPDGPASTVSGQPAPPLEDSSHARPHYAAHKEDSGAEERKMSIYGGPKMTLISPPPWDTDGVVLPASRYDISRDGHSTHGEPLRPSTPNVPATLPRKGSPTLPPGLAPSAFKQHTAPAKAVAEMGASFLDLASAKKRTAPTPRVSPPTASDHSDASGTTSASRSQPSPLPGSVSMHRISPAGKPPLLPSKEASPSVKAAPAHGPTLPVTNSASVSAFSGHALPATFAASSAAPVAAFSLISLDTAREREQDRIRAAGSHATLDEGSLPTPGDPAVPQTPKLRNKKSGFLRIFKKTDEDALSVSPPLPVLPQSPSTSESPTSILSMHTSPAMTPGSRALSPPASAPASVVTFRDANPASSSAPRGAFRDRGVAPSLSLRPVSMAISGIPSDLLADPMASPTAEAPSPMSAKSLSPSSASFRRGSSSELASVDEQIATARAAWQRQIAVLEDQVKALQSEVDGMRAVPAGFKACSTCGCNCVARRAAASVIHRQRHKPESDTERMLFASRNF